ncbi:hypothetical protein AWN90_13770 [Nocardia terpenica]|uniref:Uncharacterized protein n=2 Tax=Nocardia terpenica TaxID=455432 RepID=A0A164HVC8_9NOCA|nr:hypothetical protein AWN90_13770 [Nocardia terpenica]
MTPTLGKIQRTNVIADQVMYSVDVTYPGEPTKEIAFLRNSRGTGHVFMHLDPFGWTRVENPDRFGKFGPEWVRRYFLED